MGNTISYLIQALVNLKELLELSGKTDFPCQSKFEEGTLYIHQYCRIKLYKLKEAKEKQLLGLYY